MACRTCFFLVCLGSDLIGEIFRALDLRHRWLSFFPPALRRSYFLRWFSVLPFRSMAAFLKASGIPLFAVILYSPYAHPPPMNHLHGEETKS